MRSVDLNLAVKLNQIIENFGDCLKAVTTIQTVLLNRLSYFSVV